ncbi:transcriptional regulator, TetR family [Paenibacillus algorifonticola]|uniref:Transcriptional regulator, TetR family n=1 Tax=Paenibacillus algorifonticola TaxID=684063 RepID=A0A1I2FKF6_9BACL|nr:TetR/AcrR family transcriptional regulator [Paenibacillus algorifonticola]SFF05329.1 transcriptional regulator, TetR family [Paenibacillus algorifonticola]
MNFETDVVGRDIIEKARQLFNEHGVEAVNMHQIAKGAGIGQGTLYRRFPNKGTLCVCVLHTQFEQFKAITTQELIENAAQPVVRRLSAFIRSLLFFALELREYIRPILSAICADEKNIQGWFQAEPYAFMHATVSKLLEEAAAAGQLRPQILPTIAASLLISSFSPELMAHFKEQGYSKEFISEQYSVTFIEPLFIEAPKAENDGN